VLTLTFSVHNAALSDARAIAGLCKNVQSQAVCASRLCCSVRVCTRGFDFWAKYNTMKEIV
jgi:hypothetical protein